jgi:putative spermidine/putrescine transport system permease protein
MKQGHSGFERHILLGIFLWLAVATIVVPLLVLLVWCFLNRWAEMIPEAWTWRGIEALISGTYNLWQVCGFSLVLSLVVALISVLIATMTARAYCNYDFIGRRLVTIGSLLPIIIPVTVFGMGVHVLFIRMHLNNSLAAVILAQLLCTVPFAIKIMVDVSQAAGNRLEEQARVLGASPVSAFLHGSLPLIMPGIISALSISFIMSSSQYFLTMLLGGGKVETLATLIMPLISGSDRVVSSTFSVLFIVINAGVFALFQVVSNVLARRTGAHLSS